VIAQVPSTCGAGCGHIGAMGIELLDTTFERLYVQVKNDDLYDQAVFYELGRNFWFYGPQLGRIDPFVTGFAILNRFLSMEAVGAKGAPFKSGMSFEAFKKSILVDLLKAYRDDTRLTWKNTLATGNAPANPNNWGAADLAAAMLNVIHEEKSDAGMRAFWKAVEVLPPATTQRDSIENFLQAARSATSNDYRSLLRDY
jgi:serralysin